MNKQQPQQPQQQQQPKDQTSNPTSQPKSKEEESLAKSQEGAESEESEESIETEESSPSTSGSFASVKPKEKSPAFGEQQLTAPQRSLVFNKDIGKGKTPSTETYTGFDAVVRKDRLQRKEKFGPNAKKVRKPNNILIDIYGVIAPWTFVLQLKTFAKKQMHQYVQENWNSKLIKNVIARIREQSKIDRQAGIMVPEILDEQVADQEAVIKSAVDCIRWIMDHKPKTLSGQIDRLCTDLWSRSFDNQTLVVEVYPDVVDAFNYWRFEEFIKIYCYASGPVEGQRQFLRATKAGDLNRFIANCLNSSGGYKYDASKYRSLCAALRESRPENLLYFTDDPKKAKAAMKAGLRAVVVNRSRSTIGKYVPEETKGLIVVHTLADIQFVADRNQMQSCC